MAAPVRVRAGATGVWAARRNLDARIVDPLRSKCRIASSREGTKMAKPSKAALSKAGKTLASNSSSSSAKSSAGRTLGKG